MTRFDAPDAPGCYIFKDASGGILYVGKAKSLRKRVSQYFNDKKTDTAPKTQLLVSKISTAEFIVVGNEVEALLLESRLIKQHRPPYNVMLKDDKRYAYLLLTDEKFPRLITTRNPKAKGQLFGPYVDGFGRLQVQDACQRVFKLRTCQTLPQRACLMYHIGRCDAPCEERIGVEDYSKRVDEAARVLRGDIAPMLSVLDVQMKAASKSHRYETAKWCRDAIHALRGVQQTQSVDKRREYDEDAVGLATDGEKSAVCVLHVRKGVVWRKSEYIVDHSLDVLSEFLRAFYDTHDIPNRIELPVAVEDAATISTWLSQKRGTRVQLSVPEKGDAGRLVELATKNAALRVQDVHPGVVALRDALNLPLLPRVIEVFDISTTQGTNTVGAMVQYVNGRPNLASYRKFIIKKADTQDDVACMREVVSRRYTRVADEQGSATAQGRGNEQAAWPDLIVIDGGVTQLGAAFEVMQSLRPTQPIVSLAKQDEEIYFPNQNSAPLRLDLKHPGLLLLRAARDSVHKFVLSFHRSRRGKKSVESVLDTIDGIGPTTKKKLLAHFGSVANIKKAKDEELIAIIGKAKLNAVRTALQ